MLHNFNTVLFAVLRSLLASPRDFIQFCAVEIVAFRHILQRCLFFFWSWILCPGGSKNAVEIPWVDKNLLASPEALCCLQLVN